jgi:isopenicillin-N N-acyltransferase-like protein
LVAKGFDQKMRFPEVTITGTPDERGYAYGDLMSAEIEATIEYYATIFKKSSTEIFDLAKHFRRVIHEYNPAYCEEIEGIAAGAKIREPLWIYALNSRSEILSLDASVDANECTAIYFQSPALLGQNWDWGRQLEELAVVLQIKINQDQIIQMLTEPGIIGKIGMNSHGIGACLNILLINKPLNGVPIHIVLRAILESQSLEEAKIAIQKSGYGKASNILFGDQKGNFSFVEFAGDESFAADSKEQFMIHTNHYLMRPLNPDEGDFRNSYTRYRVAKEKASALRDFSLDEMKTILSDRSDREFPIWRAYVPDADLQEVGTVATIIMDLKAKQLQVRKGNIKSPIEDNSTAPDKNSLESFANDFVIAFESD